MCSGSADGGVSGSSDGISCGVGVVGVKGDHRKLKINRLTLDYVFLNKYTIKMKHTNFFLFLLI